MHDSSQRAEAGASGYSFNPAGVFAFGGLHPPFPALATFLRRTFYVILGLLGLVLVLVIGVVVALQFDGTQDFVASKATAYLRDKLHTEVRIGKFRTDFRHVLNLDDVYLEDQQKDTLLAVGHLGVSVDIFALLHKQINISAVELTDGRIRLTRTEPDSVNNYDFIVNAFSDPTAPVDTTASGLKYNIGRARLARVYFTQLDAVSGSDIRARVGELAVNMDEVDVDKSVYKVDKAWLRRASIAIVQTKTAPELVAPGPPKPLTVQFGLNQATLDSVQFSYRNDPAAQYIRTSIGLAEVTAKAIDLQKQRVDLTKLTLKNTTFAYAQNARVPVAQRVVNPAEVIRKLDAATDQAKAAAGQNPGWRVRLAESDISGVAVKFDNFNQPRQRTRLPALDYNHLAFSDLVLNTHNFSFSENRIAAQVDNLAGREQSGFRIDSWRANVEYDSVQIRLDSLDLITPHTRIRRSLGIGFKDLAALTDTRQLANLRVSGDLREARLGFRDILYLVPSLAGTPPFTTGPNQSVLISGRIGGRVGDLAINNLEVIGLRNTVVRARRARILGLPHTDGRLYADVDLQELRTTRADIESLVPKGTIPANISLPPTLALRGTFKGHPTTLDFNTDLTLNSSYGAVAFTGKLGAKQRDGRQPLLGTFAVRGFDAGKLLKDPTIGAITATGRINATGDLSNPNSLVGKLTATVQSARYNHYTYHGVTAAVAIDRGRYVIDASSKHDPNLNLDLQAVVNLRDARNPSYEVTKLNLRGANLTALGFYTGGDLRVQGNLKANVRGADLNTLNGSFSGTNIVIVRDNQPFALDSVDGRIVQTATRTAVDVTSGLADVHLDGNVHLGNLATEIQQHLDRYFDLPGVKYVPSSVDRHFTYELKLKNPALATKLVAGLKSISPFTLAGEYSRQQAKLTANTSIPLVRYQNYRLDSLRLAVDSNPQKLTYDLHLAQAAQDTTLKLRRPSLVGSVADNKVQTRVAILGDSANRERLALAGTLSVRNEELRRKNEGSVYQFEVAGEQILNYDTWTAGANNYLRYYPSGAVAANNLTLSNGGSQVGVQSADPTVPTSPLGLTFTNFNLQEISEAISAQDSLLAGTLNGRAEVRGLGTPRQAFTADITLGGLVFQKALLGDVAIKATNNEPGRYDLDARLTGGVGQGNDVQVTGFYLTTGAAPLNFDVAARRLNLKLIEPFSVGQVRQTTGYLGGTLTVRGSPAAPQVRGTLTTSADAGFVVPQLGSPFRLPGQELTFDDRGLKFDHFTVLDSAGHKAVADGYLLTQNLVDYTFDLTATTDKFLAVRSTAKDNELYYGRLVVDSKTTLTGPVSLIKIDTRATVAEGSNLTVVSPAADASAAQREGIVQFIDKSAPLDTLLARQLAVDTVAAAATGYDLRAVITITEATPFTIVIDPLSGDALKVRANGTLSTTIDPAGTIGLTGRLTVAQGSYHLSLYSLASKDFILRRGSTITWAGDPYNADLNLTAVYRVQAAPADLLAGQGLDNQTANTVARNRLPFRVLLNVTDQLSKPTIGFDIRLPPDQRGALGGQVEAKLAELRQPNQTSELSKQVFSLLLLGRFIQQDPFKASDSEGFVATQLRGSASAVLTDQLQSLTDKYLSGLGLDLGVTNQADYTSGSAQSRTDLNVAVRRQLFNNRLTVRLGTDIPLSGSGTGTQATQGSSSASNFAGDVSLEYNVVRSGQVRLRAFRQNAYEDIDGPIVQTGTALVYQREYDYLRELFQTVPSDIKDQRKEQRKEEKKDKQTAHDSTGTVGTKPPTFEDDADAK